MTEKQAAVRAALRFLGMSYGALCAALGEDEDFTRTWPWMGWQGHFHGTSFLPEQFQRKKEEDK